jgi:citrate/tricarballylate utilization protein
MLTINLVEGNVLFTAQTGPGAFYAVIPHGVMVWAFGLAFGYSILAMVIGFLKFKLLTEDDGSVIAGTRSATDDAASMRYMDGGGAGCTYPGEVPSRARRWFHHMTAYGFLLCFAATSVATIHHYVFSWIAPYSWWSLPVILGTVGGIGLIIGPGGLLAMNLHTYLKSRGEGVDGPNDPSRIELDAGFALLLLLTSITGMALLIWRDSAAMGMLLAVHLGIVLALFVTLPYGKMVHGVYRFAALARYARESAAGGIDGDDSGDDSGEAGGSNAPGI